jgi:D-alanine-D-alanine ligase
MNMADAADPSVRAAADVALAAAAAVGTRGLVRVDVIVDRTGRPWVLELNTVPGMTRRSLAPRAAALAGIDMPELCHRLLSECLAPVEVLS